MTLYDRAVKDNTRILTRADGFSVPVVFLSPTGASYSTRGFFIDVALDLDANGMPVVARKCAFSFSRYAAVNTDLFPTENPVDTAGAWQATFTNSIGDANTWIVDKPMPDKTLGMYTVILKRKTTRTVA